MMLPNLNKYDMKILKGLRDSHPIEFNSNVTKFYLSEMDKYVSRLQVWRITIMGETRSGKSEVGCTNALIYKKKFNYRTGSGMLYFPNYWYKMNWNKRGCCQGF